MTRHKVILSVVLFARVDSMFFSLACLSMSMFVLATALIVEFHEVILNPTDLEVLGHHPVPIRTYSAARLTNLLAYILLMTASLNILRNLFCIS